MYTGKIFINDLGNIQFEIGLLHLEFFGSRILTDIYDVKEFDDTGYIVLNTNYGEEFFDLGEELEDLGLTSYYDIQHLMTHIEKWEVVK